MGRRDHDDRRFELVERFGSDQGGQVVGKAQTRRRLIDNHHAASGGHGFQNAVFVQRRYGARVDHFNRDAFGGQFVGHLVGFVDHGSQRDDGHVGAFAGVVGHAERDGVRLFGYFALDVVKRFVFTEHHRVVVANRLDQQAFNVVRRRRHHHFEARRGGKNMVRRLRVLRRCREARADHAAHHHRRFGLAAEHVAELGRLVVEHVVAHAEKVHEHQLGHWPQPGHCRARRHADNRRLGDRGVDHPCRAELGPQAFGHAQHAAERFALAAHFGSTGLTAAHVFADQHHTIIERHFLRQGFFDRFTISTNCHGSTPQ